MFNLLLLTRGKIPDSLSVYREVGYLPILLKMEFRPLIRASCVRSTSRVYVRYFVVMQIAMRMWVVTECPSLLLMLSRSPRNELILIHGIKSIITLWWCSEGFLIISSRIFPAGWSKVTKFCFLQINTFFMHQ